MRHLTLVVLAIVACRAGSDDVRAEAAERPVDRAAATVGEPSPKTADCRSWADLDVAQLPALPTTAYTASFEAVWRTVLEKHYDPTLACADWPAIRELYGGRLAEAANLEEAYSHINAMLGTLGQSHLRAVPPGVAESATSDDGPAFVPLAVRILDGRAVVTGGLEEGAPALALGAVLIAVDGRLVQDEIRAPLQAPGRDAERRLHAGRSVSAMLRCPIGGARRLTFLDPARDDAETQVDVPCVLPQTTESLGNLRDVPVRVSSRMIEGAPVGYLAFNVWMVPLMDAHIRPALSQLKRAGMEALVLDLRGNPGGVGAMAIPMARELTRTKLDLGTLRMREMTQEYAPEGSPDAFTGPVVLLIDEGTASTSEIFAMGMRDAGRVRIVGGSTSAGMALPSLMEELPDGGRLQYVVGDYTSPRGTVPEGEGIEPDLLVRETREDFARGKDPVLDAGVRMAQEQLREAR